MSTTYFTEEQLQGVLRVLMSLYSQGYTGAIEAAWHVMSDVEQESIIEYLSESPAEGEAGFSHSEEALFKLLAAA